MLACFSITNADHIAERYCQDRMLRFTAMQMRELLWDPRQRDGFQALLQEFGDPDLEDFIQNVSVLKLHVDYKEGVHCKGIIIPVFGQEAIF